MSARDWLKLALPPLVLQSYRGIRNRVTHTIPEWEYLPTGWPAAGDNPQIKGWNVRNVLSAAQARWPEFVKQMNSNQPFGLSPEAIRAGPADLVFHNTVMCFAYALAMAARNKRLVSMLDWGGALGYYLLISQRLIPELEIEYHCKEVQVLADYGRVLWPEAAFHSDNKCLERQYDLVLASCSLHYEENWRDLLARLAGATAGYLFVTRLPVVNHSPSYAFVQRPYAYGYNTEYVGWCLNRDEFLMQAESIGLKLLEEFITGEQPFIAGAPEQCQYRGFLFSSVTMQEGQRD